MLPKDEGLRAVPLPKIELEVMPLDVEGGPKIFGENPDMFLVWIKRFCFVQDAIKHTRGCVL